MIHKYFTVKSNKYNIPYFLLCICMRVMDLFNILNINTECKYKYRNGISHLPPT